MTGRELIEKLQAIPEDQKDYEVNFLCGNGCIWEVENIEVEDLSTSFIKDGKINIY